MNETPSKENFEKLLSWLSPDREQAGEKYEKIRRRSISLLSAKGCWVAEDLTDQAINVVASKVDSLRENYEGDPALFFYGVAKKLFLEWRKKNPPPDLPPDLPLIPDDNSEIERLCGQLEEWLQEIPPEDSKLVLAYHEGEKQERINNRKRLAQELGITANALRIRVCHIHSRLRRVMERRLGQLPDG